MDGYRDCFIWVPCPYWGALCFGLQDSFGGLALLCGSLSFLIQRLMCWVGPFGVRIDRAIFDSFRSRNVVGFFLIPLSFSVPQLILAFWLLFLIVNAFLLS